MTKADLKSATGFDTSAFAKKVDLTSLKSKIDKLYIDKLETAPVDLIKISDVVKNEVVIKVLSDELVKNLMPFRLLILVI